MLDVLYRIICFDYSNSLEMPIFSGILALNVSLKTSNIHTRYIAVALWGIFSMTFIFYRDIFHTNPRQVPIFVHEAFARDRSLIMCSMRLLGMTSVNEKASSTKNRDVLHQGENNSEVDES